MAWRSSGSRRFRAPFAKPTAARASKSCKHGSAACWETTDAKAPRTCCHRGAANAGARSASGRKAKKPSGHPVVPSPADPGSLQSREPLYRMPCDALLTFSTAPQHSRHQLRNASCRTCIVSQIRLFPGFLAIRSRAKLRKHAWSCTYASGLHSS